MEELNRQFSDKALRDFKLIDLATEGKDDSAYAELMDRYKKPVYHMILKMVRNVDDAEDLTIEAFRSGPILVTVVRDPDGSGDFFHASDSQSNDSNSECPEFSR